MFVYLSDRITDLEFFKNLTGLKEVNLRPSDT